MGTNYYHRTDTCPCCGRYDERHIGKKSGGWSFSFHGYDDEDGPIIRSWLDWKVILTSGVIINEYDEIIPFDEFLTLVEESRNEEFNHTIYCRESHPEHAASDCWLDDEGFSFQRGDFR